MNEALRGRKLLIVGLTLFSMFFGAGNLIFPPFLAAQAGTAVWPALLGFLVSAVGLPVLGVIAVSRSGGLDRLAGRVHPAFARVFTILIYLSIGPCLAIPRTASTSFEMTVLPVLRDGQGTAVWQLIYSVGFFFIAALLALNPERLTQRLGKILCPVLLCLIFLLFAGSLFTAGQTAPEPAAAYSGVAPVSGFLEGYQTMDTIAALNFGIVISLNIREIGVRSEKAVMSSTIRSGLIAGVLLAVVYIALAYTGIKAGPSAQSLDNGAKVLTFAAGTMFGSAGEAILGVIFFIACLNTCVGLLSCCSEFFCQLIPVLKYRMWVLLFAAVSVVVAKCRPDQNPCPVYPGVERHLSGGHYAYFPLLLKTATRGNVPPGRPVYGNRERVLCRWGAGIAIPGVNDMMVLLPGYSLGLGWICRELQDWPGRVTDRRRFKKSRNDRP